VLVKDVAHIQAAGGRDARGYFTTSVTERFFRDWHLLFDLRGIATDATYSLTVRRTSSSRSALDFAGRTTLIILRAMPFLLKRVTSCKSGGSAGNRQGRPFHPKDVGLNGFAVVGASLAR